MDVYDTHIAKDFKHKIQEGNKGLKLSAVWFASGLPGSHIRVPEEKTTNKEILSPFRRRVVLGVVTACQYEFAGS